MVSVKAAATGRVSWGPMVSGLGPREQAKTNREQQVQINQTILRKIRLKWEFLKCHFLVSLALTLNSPYIYIYI